MLALQNIASWLMDGWSEDILSLILSILELQCKTIKE